VAEGSERPVELIAVDLDGEADVGEGEVDPTHETPALAYFVLAHRLGETVITTETPHAGLENGLGPRYCV